MAEARRLDRLVRRRQIRLPCLLGLVRVLALPTSTHAFDSRQLHQEDVGERPFHMDRSSDLYDDLALCAPLLDVGQSFRGRLEGKDPIYDRAYDAGIYERAELA